MIKEQFVKIINLIQNFHSEQETLSAMINKITDGYSIVTIGDYLIVEIINMINESMNIEDKDLIPWWLYEDVDKIIYYNDGREISVKAVEELYDYIVSGE